jgi:4-aminobutyrate aminotransferase
MRADLCGRAETMGDKLKRELTGLKARYPFIGDVRGKGLMIGFDLVEDRATRAPAHDLRDRLVDAAFQQGLLLLGAGTGAIRFCPPLVLTKELADEGLDIMERLFAQEA